MTGMLLEVLPKPQLSSRAEPFLQRLERSVSPKDQMFMGNAQHYLSCGASALTAILTSLSIAEITNVGSILDFGAGAGRVTRWLRAAFPNSMLDCCDLASVDLDFCQRMFRAQVWASTADIGALTAPKTYDLIWLGSVATHLPPERTVDLVAKMHSWTNPGGVVVMSLHGRYAVQRQSKGNFSYIDADRWKTITEEYERTGYGYADYPGQNGYGISVTAPSWISAVIERAPHLRLLAITERGWDGHHDVVSFQAVADPLRS